MNPVSFLINCFYEEHDRWFLWLPVFMLAGIVVYFDLPAEPSQLWVLLTPVGLCLLLPLRYAPNLLILVAPLTAFIVGFNAAQFETSLRTHPMLAAPMPAVSVTGMLMRAEALPDGARLTVTHPSIEGLPRNERPASLRIKVKTPYADLPEPGMRVNVWGPLWPPNDPVLPGGYDFRRQAFFKDLGGTGLSYVPPRSYTPRYPPHFGDRAALSLEHMRRALNLATITTLKEPEKAMTAALLSGSQSGIDRPVMEAMRASGLSHLLSISGVHVSMMALLVYVPLRYLFALIPWLALRLPIKKIAAFASIFATAFYTLLVGADAPTVRSALMTGLVFFAIMTDRRAMSLRLLALAASLIMLTTPSAAMGASFQMSFAAVLAMMAAYEKRPQPAALSSALAFEQVEPPEKPFEGPVWLAHGLRHLRDIIITSLIATAATTPFTIFHFQTFSFYGVVANMLAIPLTSVWIMPCLLLTYLALPLGLATPFIEGAGWGVAKLIAIAEHVASWPLAQIPFAPMPVWALIAIVGGGLWLCLWQTKWRYAGIIAMLAGCTYPSFVTLPDVYISDDKPVWSVMLRDGRMAVYGKRKEDFTISQWLQHNKKPEALYLSAKTDEALPEELSCDKEFCAYTPPTASGQPRVIFLHKEATAETIAKACANKDLVVVAFQPLPDCLRPQATIDASSLAEHGAYSLTFTEHGVHIDFVHKKRGQRPWEAGWTKGVETVPD